MWLWKHILELTILISLSTMVDDLLQHTMKTQLQQQCNNHNMNTKFNSLQEKVSVGQWVITESQTSQGSSKILDEIDAELLETEKKRESLLKRHHLTLIQQDNKALQHISNIDVMSNSCSKQENDDSCSEQECASSVVSSKWLLWPESYWLKQIVLWQNLHRYGVETGTELDSLTYQVIDLMRWLVEWLTQQIN